MSAISDLYIRTQVESALAEACGELLDEKFVAPRLISALEDRDIELRPR
jgi:HEAT repeat protein